MIDPTQQTRNRAKSKTVVYVSGSFSCLWRLRIMVNEDPWKSHTLHSHGNLWPIMIPAERIYRKGGHLWPKPSKLPLKDRDLSPPRTLPCCTLAFQIIPHWVYSCLKRCRQGNKMLLSEMPLPVAILNHTRPLCSHAANTTQKSNLILWEQGPTYPQGLNTFSRLLYSQTCGALRNWTKHKHHHSDKWGDGRGLGFWRTSAAGWDIANQMSNVQGQIRICLPGRYLAPCMLPFLKSQGTPVKLIQVSWIDK